MLQVCSSAASRRSTRWRSRTSPAQARSRKARLWAVVGCSRAAANSASSFIVGASSKAYPQGSKGGDAQEGSPSPALRPPTLLRRLTQLPHLGGERVPFLLQFVGQHRKHPQVTLQHRRGQILA